MSTLPVLSQYSLCEVCDCPAEGCDRAMCVQEMSVVTRPGTSYISQDNSGGITRRESNMRTDMKIVSMRVSSPTSKIHQQQELYHRLAVEEEKENSALKY